MYIMLHIMYVYIQRKWSGCSCGDLKVKCILNVNFRIRYTKWHTLFDDLCLVFFFFWLSVHIVTEHEWSRGTVQDSGSLTFRTPLWVLCPWARYLVLILILNCFVDLSASGRWYTTWIKKNCARIADVLDLGKITEP